MKKVYTAPSMKSIKINEPLAFACVVHNASTHSGSWSGMNLGTELILDC